LCRVRQGIEISKRLNPFYLPRVPLSKKSRIHLGLLQACDFLGLPFRPSGTRYLEKRAEVFLSAENYRGQTDYQRSVSKARFMGNANYYLASLLIFRSMKDDLPANKLSSTDPDYGQYKCVGGNILVIRSVMHDILANRIIRGIERSKQIEGFLAWKPDLTRLTTKEEIERINRILDLVINWLRPLTNEAEVRQYLYMERRN